MMQDQLSSLASGIECAGEPVDRREARRPDGHSARVPAGLPRFFVERSRSLPTGSLRGRGSCAWSTATSAAGELEHGRLVRMRRRDRPFHDMPRSRSSLRTPARPDHRGNAQVSLGVDASATMPPPTAHTSPEARRVLRRAVDRHPARRRRRHRRRAPRRAGGAGRAVLPAVPAGREGVAGRGTCAEVRATSRASCCIDARAAGAARPGRRAAAAGRNVAWTARRAAARRA